MLGTEEMQSKTSAGISSAAGQACSVSCSLAVVVVAKTDERILFCFCAILTRSMGGGGGGGEETLDASSAIGLAFLDKL